MHPAPGLRKQGLLMINGGLYVVCCRRDLADAVDVEWGLVNACSATSETITGRSTRHGATRRQNGACKNWGTDLRQCGERAKQS